MTTYDTPSVGHNSEEPEGMSTVRGVFERAANAIVEASKLAKQMAEIQLQLNLIKQEVEEVHRRNQELDEMLTTTRQQRDEARGKLYDTERELHHTKTELGRVQTLLDQAVSEKNSLNERLNSTQNELAQYMDHWHKAEEAREAAEAKLKDIEGFAQQAFGLVRPTQSTTPVEGGGQSSEPSQGGSVHGEAQPVNEAPPAFGTPEYKPQF